MKIDIHAKVTDMILTELENGAAPWIKPWTDNPGLPVSVPQNGASGYEYRGGNIILCWLYAAMFGYTDQRWMTPKQAMQLGGNIKGTKTVLITAPMKGWYTDDDGQKRSYVKGFRALPVLNIEQVEGLPADLTDRPEPGTIPPGAIETFVNSLGIRIEHGFNRACFIPARDVVQMPNPDQFKTEADYWATLFHELIHATMTKERTGRGEGKQRDKNAYAFEELVAELGAAFLCAEWGVEGKLRHAGYIEGWITLLKDDQKAFMSAAGKASVAVLWMRDKANEVVKQAA